MSHRSLLVILPVLLTCFSTHAQETNPLRGLDESAATAVRKKAMDLLVSVAGQVDSLRSAENRARIGSNLGDLLWEQDEKRSRTLFAAVAEDIKLGFNKIGPTDPEHVTDPEHAPDEEHIHTLLIFWRLRDDTIGRIVKHDPELALEFLRATRLPPDIKVPPYLMDDNEESLELRLASQIAAKNPQLALKLGRQSLAKGFSSELLLPLLSDLRRKDKEAALTFYKEIVEKLRGTNLSQDWQGTETAMNLVRSFEPPDADEQVYRDLIGILLTSASANGCSEANAKENDEPPQICYAIGSLFPKLVKYYGSRAAPLKRWFDDSSYGEGEVWAQMQEVTEKGTVDEILALATKHPEMQTQIYWSAMEKARTSGDTSRAREIASKYPDEARRREALEELDREQMWKSLDENKLALVQEQLSRMRNNEERIYLIFHVATQARGNNRQAALRLLNQAGQLIDSLKPGKKQLEAQIGLSMMYCSLKSDRAFAILEPLIPKLNELVAAASTLDGFETNYLRDGEWNMSGQGEVGRLLTALAQNAGYFAALDFDRAVNLASQMERPELRLMADLKIAQGVLTSQPNPALMFRSH